MIKRILIFAFLALGLLPAEKAPFTIETLYQVQNVSDPQISPDGERIAFVVTSYNLEEGSRNSEVYLVDKTGNNLRRMTKNPANDVHPRWSPDGRHLLFISDRKNGTQAWEIPVYGGEAESLTDISTGVSSAEWVGDKNKIVFSSTVFPECGADDSCNQAIQKRMDEGPVQAHMADELLYRHWTFYKDGKRRHIILYDIVRDSTVDLTPGPYDAPSLWGSFDVSADGRWLCYESKQVANPAESTNNDLFLIDLADGETTNITKGNKAYDGNPVFSPDGRYIAYQMQTIPGYESDLKRLAIYDRQRKQSRILTGDFNNWVQNYRWHPDGSAIYFIAHEKAHFPLYRIDLNTNQTTKILDLKTINAYDIDPEGEWVAAIGQAVERPTELFRAAERGAAQYKQAVRLTHFNDGLRESVDFRPAEEMWIESPTGKKIHTFVVKPHNFDPDKSYPLILNVHGGPQFQWYDGFRGDWQVYPGSGYVVAFPNPHGSSGYGQAFTRAISEDWTGKVYTDVMAVSDYLAGLPYVDERRMGAMGWSYGGYFMMWLEGHNPDKRFKALAAMMGLYDLTAFYGATEELWFPEWDLGGTPWESDLYERHSPHNYVEKFNTPCLVITGERDYRVPYTQSLAFFTALQKQNVDSRLIVFENDGHWPDFVKSMPFYYNAHLDWFHKHLGGKPAPYDMKIMWRNRVEY